MSSTAQVIGNVGICERGLVFGDTYLARFAGNTGRLVLDPERVTGLLSVVSVRPLTYRNLEAIAAAAAHWQLGDRALANLRLVLSGLPQLDAPADLYRLKAAEILFDAGVTAADLAKVFQFDAETVDFDKGYNAAQPRVPAGSGQTSEQWTDGLWSRFSAWLNEDVPEYDQDTGIQVGMHSRARAIALNPLTVGLAGAVALLGGEALLPSAAAGAAVEGPAAVSPIAEETEALTPLARQYLSRSGGRLGSTKTRQQLHELAREYDGTGCYIELKGDGYRGEEFLRDPVSGKGTYVDFTAKHLDGSTVRIQTIDTLADGVTPTAREMMAVKRIEALRPADKLILVPKR